MFLYIENNIYLKTYLKKMPNIDFFFTQKCLPKSKMDIYKCPKMRIGESNMEKACFNTIIEN